MTRIRTLSIKDGDRIRHSAYLRSLSEAAIEIVSNAIDADATEIVVECHWKEQRFKVVDNGHGIRADDFDKIGSICCTSKTSGTFLGFRGQALFSLCQIAFVRICTRTKDDEFASCKEIMKGSTLSSKQIPIHFDHGTIVWVSEFLKAFPVRRRVSEQIGFDSQKSSLRWIGS